MSSFSLTIAAAVLAGLPVCVGAQRSDVRGTLHLETVYADSSGHAYLHGRRVDRVTLDSAVRAVRAERGTIFFSWSGSPALRTAGEDSVFALLERDHVNFELRSDSTLHAAILPRRTPRTDMLARGDTQFTLRRWESGHVDTIPYLVAHERSGMFLSPVRRPMTAEQAATFHRLLGQMQATHENYARVMAKIRAVYLDSAGRVYEGGKRVSTDSAVASIHRFAAEVGATVWLSWAGAPRDRTAAQNAALARIRRAGARVELRTDSTMFPRVIPNPDERAEQVIHGDTVIFIRHTLSTGRVDTASVLLVRADSVIRLRPLPRAPLRPEIADIMRRSLRSSLPPARP